MLLVEAVQQYPLSSGKLSVNHQRGQSHVPPAQSVTAQGRQTTVLTNQLREVENFATISILNVKKMPVFCELEK